MTYPMETSHIPPQEHRVRLQVEWYHAPWLRALPLHPSQVEEVTAEDYSVFAYHLPVTPDLLHRLRLLADYIDILEPEWLREEIEEEG